MIGRATGLVLAALVALGGMALAANAATVAGHFEGPAWILASIYMLALFAGTGIGVTGAWLGLEWVETRRRRKAHDDARG